MPLEKNKIYQGDCVEQLSKIEPGSIDLAFADPPFNIGYQYDVYDDSQSSDSYLQWCERWIAGVYQSLKPTGTFWLAIGDEYAAELKIASQQAGFHCRSWVIWYYTFGVNCRNGFSRSHTHLFHFVKDPKKFTFVRPNPNIRVKSARQLVYADNRANPLGRLPDNTWITRPQDAPDSFRPNHDTWFFSRVAGTFSEREGFHGCQMPEQLLARIIRTSSNPHEIVLDPFGGSGTTMSVAKKLRRNWIGIELSKDYVKHINKRLQQTHPGDSIDGPDDPIESAPATTSGKKKREQEFDDKTIESVIEAFEAVSDGLPLEQLLCDKDFEKRFWIQCKKKKLGGGVVIWNRLLLSLQKSRKLPKTDRKMPEPPAAELDRYGYASEIAWRLISEEFCRPGQNAISLDDILCCPDTAEYFDQIATSYGPQDIKVSSQQYRLAAIAYRKKKKAAMKLAAKKFGDWSSDDFNKIPWDADSMFERNSAGVYLIKSETAPVFVGVTSDLGRQLNALKENQRWQTMGLDFIYAWTEFKKTADNEALKTVLVQQEKPLLNIV